MKKVLLSVIFITITFYLSAQWQQNGNNIFFSEGNVGIGTNFPNYLLDIQGDADLYSLTKRQFITLTNINNSTHSNVALHYKSGTDYNEAKGSLGVCAYSYIANPGLKGYTYLLGFNSGIAIRAQNASGNIKFITGGNTLMHERMRIDSTGNVGIGTNSPCTKFHIEEGDIFLEDINSGIIMTSPNGSYWKITVDNSGNLVTSSISSPCKLFTAVSKIEVQNIDLNIFPNPSENSIKVEVISEESLSLNVEIFNINGKEIFYDNLNSSITEIDISKFSSGTYILRITDNQGNVIKSKKFIKK